MSLSTPPHKFKNAERKSVAERYLKENGYGAGTRGYSVYLEDAGCAPLPTGRTLRSDLKKVRESLVPDGKENMIEVMTQRLFHEVKWGKPSDMIGAQRELRALHGLDFRLRNASVANEEGVAAGFMAMMQQEIGVDGMVQLRSSGLSDKDIVRAIAASVGERIVAQQQVEADNAS